jgi:hypothetical protein
MANGMFKTKWTSIATVPDLCPTTVKILTHLITRYQLPFSAVTYQIHHVVGIDSTLVVDNDPGDLYFVAGNAAGEPRRIRHCAKKEEYICRRFLCRKFLLRHALPVPQMDYSLHRVPAPRGPNSDERADTLVLYVNLNYNISTRLTRFGIFFKIIMSLLCLKPFLVPLRNMADKI